MEEGFGYPLTIFTNPNYPQTSEEGGEEEDQPEVPLETHPKNNVNKNFSPNDSDSAHVSMPEEDVPAPSRMKMDLGPYCPVCTLLGTDAFAMNKSQTGMITEKNPSSQYPKLE